MITPLILELASIRQVRRLYAVDVDDSFLAPRRSHAHTRLRGDARGCDGRVCQELAPGNEAGQSTNLFVIRATMAIMVKRVITALLERR